MELVWLGEFRRVTNRGGYLLLTMHGEEVFLGDSEEDKGPLLEHGFCYSVCQETEGLPAFYQTSFHTADYIYSQWGKSFEIERIVKKGARRIIKI